MLLQLEEGRHDGRHHDADEDGREDLGEAGEDEEDGQDDKADHECGADGPVQASEERLDLGSEALGIGREPEELRQLSDDDHDRQAVHVTDLHLVGKEIGHEPELGHARGRSQ